MTQHHHRSYTRVLTIAGSDSGGGAGIQADLKTFAANGCFGMTVITALTAQNTCGVTGIHPVPAQFVDAQLEAVFSDIGADAVKIGMLFSPELIEVVESRLIAHRPKQIVLDPVMVAQSGDSLLRKDAIQAIKTRLLPLATVITPNIPEARILLGKNIQDMKESAKALANLCRFVQPECGVLLKGGHGDDTESTDILYLTKENRFVSLPGYRINTVNTHGTGCTLSSAVAAQLALGENIETAVGKAKTFIQKAIESGSAYKIGHGSGPVHHFYSFWK